MQPPIPKKICQILNGENSYILRVDGLEIRFHGHDAMQYFDRHYRALGYLVELLPQ